MIQGQLWLIILMLMLAGDYPGWSKWLVAIANIVTLAAYAASDSGDMKDVDVSKAVYDRITKQEVLLLDAWTQFAYPNKLTGGYDDGGLSTLEALNEHLQEYGLIDADGKVTNKVTAQEAK